MEKLSEKEIRDKKIVQLKEKIKKEIEEKILDNKQYMKAYFEENDFDTWNSLITEAFALLKLKEYVELNTSFNMIETCIPEKDIIIYTISIDLINLWLQDEYKFVNQFLLNMEYDEIKNVFTMLNEKYFAYEFTNIYDIILYKQKNET